MVITTGMIRSSLACACVAALNSLQNCMMLTPCCPRAGPTGGAGLALPAGICSFTCPVTFFISGLLHLHEIELDRGRAAEDAHQNAQSTLVRIHFLNRAVEVREGAIGHADLIALLEEHFRFRLERSLGDLAGQTRHLGIRHRRDHVRPLGVELLPADEPSDLGGALHQVPGPLVHLHVDEDVAGEELALARALLALHHLHDLLHGDQDFVEIVHETLELDPLLEALFGLVLEARVRVHDVPTLPHGLRLFFARLHAHRPILVTTAISFGSQPVITFAPTVSKAPRISAQITVIPSTAKLLRWVSAHVGQVTFLTSTATSNTSSRIL